MFGGYGKKKTWNARRNHNAATETMIKLTTNPQMVKEDSVHNMQSLEKCMVRLYSKDYSLNIITDVRMPKVHPKANVS